jgi:sugar lactone lactonase YvrE
MPQESAVWEWSAGNGTLGFSGDGGLATSASLYYPWGLAVDSVGNIYISDIANNRVRKVSTGIITTIVGNGSWGYSGDNGSASDAQLNGPLGISLDASDNLFVVDEGNNVIRKVSSGIISTIAGNGTGGYSAYSGPAISTPINWPQGVAIDGNENIYISDSASGSGLIQEVTASNNILSTVAGVVPGYGGDGGPATEAFLSYPTGIAFDGVGNIFIADQSDNQIRKVATGSGIITTINTNNTLYRPQSVVVDSTGNLYILDNWGEVGVVPATTGVYTQPSILSNFLYPVGIAVDASNNVYVTDQQAATLSVYNPATGSLSVLVNASQNGLYTGDGGPAMSAGLDYPGAVAVDSNGNVYLVNDSNVLVIYSSGKIPNIQYPMPGYIYTVAGNGTYGYSGDGGLATSASLESPQGLAVDAAGNLYISDNGNNAVRKVSISTGIITTIAGSGPGGFGGDGGSSTSALLDNPQGIALDPSGNLFIADADNNVIRRVGPQGILSFGQQAVNTTSTSQGLTLSNRGNATLNLSSPTVTGNFATASNTCGTTLASGATCTFSAIYTPTTAGILTSAVEFTNNGANPFHGILLNGGTPGYSPGHQASFVVLSDSGLLLGQWKSCYHDWLQRHLDYQPLSGRPRSEDGGDRSHRVEARYIFLGYTNGHIYCGGKQVTVGRVR